MIDSHTHLDLCEPPNAELYGSDGRELVFWRSDAGVIHMSWYPQPAANTGGRP